MDLTGFECPVAENIDPSSIDTNSDNSGFFVTVDEGATTGSFTINVFDNLEPDRALPEILDGLVESEFSLVATDGVNSENTELAGDLGDYTLNPDAASSTVLFADDESQLPVSAPPLNPGYDEAVSGDISTDPNNPLELPLSEGITPYRRPQATEIRSTLPSPFPKASNSTRWFSNPFLRATLLLSGCKKAIPLPNP